jgi:hypothetical protein
VSRGKRCPSHGLALDLSLFGALKRRKDRSSGEFGDGNLKDQITKLPKVHEETSTSFTIRGSFRRAIFLYRLARSTHALVFSQEKVRENP